MKNYKKYILLVIIFLLVTYIIYNSHNDNIISSINYDRTNKTITKEELLDYDDYNKCSFNKELLGSAEDYDYKKIFNKNKIQDVYIDINQNNLYYLLENAIDKPSVFINNIKIGDYSIDCASIKTKGLTTLRYVWSYDYNKFSFTVNFKKYNKEQNLFGLTKISFNNMFSDPSMLKEFTSYYLFNEMGLDTVDYSFVNLYINNEYYGVYFMIEPIEKPLLNRTMNSESDFFFKPNGYGASLLYDYELDNYLDVSGNYNFDSLVYNESGNFSYPRNKDNILNKYKAIWEDDADSFKKVYNDLPIFFKTIRKLNELNSLENKNTKYFEEELEKIIDVDKLIRFLAVDNYLVNTDGYVNNPARNYALYMNKDGFLTIVPWDYNMTFGSTILDDINSVINYDIYNPTINCDIKDRPLINVILGNDNYRNKYNEYLKDITKIMTEGGTTFNNNKYKKNNVLSIIDKYSTDLINNNTNCIQQFYNSSEIELGQKNLKEVYKLRSKSVLNQINGVDNKIKSDIDINSLGNLRMKK